MLRYVLLLAIVFLSLSCASSGSTNDDGSSASAAAMQVFTLASPPQCNYGVVGTVQRKPYWATTAERQAAWFDYRMQVKRMGGDAVIRVDRPWEYMVIKFTDPDCRE